ncbi:MAG: hypothetical protein WC757_01235 [Candidatus Paceibacterota bacterium]|jgi:hypothetical protein
MDIDKKLKLQKNVITISLFLSGIALLFILFKFRASFPAPSTSFNESLGAFALLIFGIPIALVNFAEHVGLEFYFYNIRKYNLTADKKLEKRRMYCVFFWFLILPLAIPFLLFYIQG